MAACQEQAAPRLRRCNASTSDWIHPKNRMLHSSMHSRHTLRSQRPERRQAFAQTRVTIKHGALCAHCCHHCHCLPGPLTPPHPPGSMPAQYALQCRLQSCPCWHPHHPQRRQPPARPHHRIPQLALVTLAQPRRRRADTRRLRRVLRAELGLRDGGARPGVRPRPISSSSQRVPRLSPGAS